MKIAKATIEELEKNVHFQMDTVKGWLSVKDYETALIKAECLVEELQAIVDMEEQTIGEQRVRTKFNPSADSVVDQIKQKTAELINLCEELKAKDGRLASLAQTEYETAAMWAVKAATA